ncbi:MAG: hypothetical protein O3A73_04945 [Proteobacteria bacterium]|nr:hypothetical protein [Pseudomonadota bacterium]
MSVRLRWNAYAGLATHLDIEDDDALFGRATETLVPDLLVRMCAMRGSARGRLMRLAAQVDDADRAQRRYRRRNGCAGCRDAGDSLQFSSSSTGSVRFHRGTSVSKLNHSSQVTAKARVAGA